MNLNRIYNDLLRTSFRGASRRFQRACGGVRQAQERILLADIRKNEDTRFGRRHGFRAIRSVDDFRASVPVTSYEDYLPYIEALRSGEKAVLTAESPDILTPTSGSSSATKYIPVTKRLRSEFREGIAAWMADLYDHRPMIAHGRFYWVISPGVETGHCGGSAIPVGFDDDTGYFDPIDRQLLRRLLVGDGDEPGPAGGEEFQYRTLLSILSEREISFISVWSPSYLVILLEKALECSGRLSEDIRARSRERSKEVERAFGAPREEIFEALWPRLDTISCWGDAGSRGQMELLRRYFPGTYIQPKGLLATEGCVSIPMAGREDGALSINSHFLEFQECGSAGTTLLAHEIRPGRAYAVIMTTGGGFYRYRLGDVVEVTGFIGQCPLVRFAGREDKVSDHFGEKLNEHHIAAALPGILEKDAVDQSFCFIAFEEDGDRSFYTLFIETEKPPPPGLAAEIERSLRKNFNYSCCRDLGQLDRLRIFHISASGMETYRGRKGPAARESTVKPPLLDLESGWSRLFTGRFI